MRKIFLLVVVCATPIVLCAQDTLKSTTLSEVVISATRSEKSIIEIPRSVSVISRDELEKSVCNSVGELLSRQQGVYMVGALQTPGTNQSMFMRGANSNQVVVLMDGMRISDPSTPNAVIDLSELSLTDVDHIEIIRGSHSTMYGGSAIGGVVNIITRKNQRAGLNGLATVQGGTMGKKAVIGSQAIDINYTLKNGLYFNGSIMNQMTNGLNATIDTVHTPGVFKTSDQDGFYKTDGYVKAGYHQGKWNGNVSYKKVDQHAEIDKGVYADDENNYVDFTRDLLATQIEYRLNDFWQFNFQGSWSESKRLNENDSSKIDRNGNYDGNYFLGKYYGGQRTNELQLTYRNENLDGVLGYGMYRENMHFNTYFFSNAFGPFESAINYDSIKTEAKTKYAFLQLNWKQHHFGLSGGARISNHSIFGNSVTFEVNPSFQLENLLIYASISSGFNAPSLYQLFDPTKDFGSFTSRGNKKLDPERSVSYEVGVKREFSSGSYVTASVFQTQIKNAIEYIYLWDQNTSVSNLSWSDYRGDTYLNITEQKVSGIELDGHIVVSKKILFNANFTGMAGSISVHPNAMDLQQTGAHHVQLYGYGVFVEKEINKNYLVRRPKLMGGAEVVYRAAQKLLVSTAYRYTGARPDSQYDYNLGPFGALGQSNVRSYHLIDINAQYQLTKHLSMTAKIENLFDQPYQEIIGFQTRGRSAFLKLSVSL